MHWTSTCRENGSYNKMDFVKQKGVGVYRNIYRCGRCGGMGDFLGLGIIMVKLLCVGGGGAWGGSFAVYGGVLIHNCV